MKTVFTNHELPHLWAHQTQSHGQNPKRSLHFDGPSYYSYSTEIGRVIERKGCKAYLINVTSYSVTTSAHQSRMRSAIPNDATVFSIGRIARGQMPSTQNIGPFLFEYAIHRSAEHAASHKRCRQPWSKDFELAQQAHWLEKAVEVNKFFGLRRKVDDKVVERLAAATERDRKRRDKEEKARQAKLEAQKKEQLEAWLVGSPFGFPYGINKVYLRVIMDSGSIPIMQTSRGVIVPLDQAEQAFRFAITRRQKGWRRNGEECKVGNYQLDAVNETGVIAGCHHITWEEVERFAKQQGWI